AGWWLGRRASAASAGPGGADGRGGREFRVGRVRWGKGRRRASAAVRPVRRAVPCRAMSPRSCPPSNLPRGTSTPCPRTGCGGPGRGRWSGRARIPGGTRTVGEGPPTGLVGGPPCEEDCSMPRNVAQKLLADHLVEGTLDPGSEIGLRVDQTLTQDATGTMVMLELEAVGLDRIRTELSVQYVDHNLLQTDEKNPDDHLFLQSAAERFGLWYSKAGNGVSHPVHQAHFGRPGALLIGSDSHTCAAGALGML